MSEQESMENLLALTEKISKRQRTNTILCIVVLVFLIGACCYIGFRITETIQQFKESIIRIDTAAENIQSFIDSFQAAGYDSPEQAVQELHDTAENINGILNSISENGIFGLSGLGDGTDVMEQAKEWFAGLFG